MKIKLDEGAFLPEHAHKWDAGYDLRTPIGFTIEPNKDIVIDTGVHIGIPTGFVGFLKSKSGLNTKCGLIGEGVIDSEYTGSIRVRLLNTGDKVVRFDRGIKIIQIVFLPVFFPIFEQVDELKETDRGDNGFGSTGK